MEKYRYIVVLFIIAILLISGGCQNSIPETPINGTAPGTTEPVKPTETLIPATATAIPLPIAASVNNEGILLADFDNEYQRYLDATVITGASTDEQIAKATVLESMVDNVLLAQAARENGFQLDETLVTQRYNEMVNTAGGEEQFNEWLRTNHYADESFLRLFKIEIEAAWMRDRIVGEVPKRSEQIRARQILVQSKSLADEIYQRLEAGSDFATIAWTYDPLTGGELSWFPRNYLVLKNVEEAVFNLQPGQYTPVIETPYGYQIVMVMERELDRPLTQDALLTYQRIALSNWVQDQKAKSDLIFDIS
jgi:peptidyl-prolyl cis-trans isomerase C